MDRAVRLQVGEEAEALSVFEGDLVDEVRVSAVDVEEADAVRPSQHRRAQVVQGSVEGRLPREEDFFFGDFRDCCVVRPECACRTKARAVSPSSSFGLCAVLKMTIQVRSKGRCSPRTVRQKCSHCFQ